MQRAGYPYFGTVPLAKEARSIWQERFSRSWKTKTNRSATRDRRVEEEVTRSRIGKSDIKKGGEHLRLGRQEKFRFIKYNKSKFTVEKMCRTLEVSKSGYYNRLRLGPSKRWLENQAMSDNLSTRATIVPALNMAIKDNKITEEPIFRSDRGTRYASYGFTNILKGCNGLVKQSMGRKGDCWDNVVAGSFFKSLKVEWAYKHNYGLRSEAGLWIFQWIETRHNRRRIHSSLGHKTIKEFETEMFNQNVAA